MSGLFPDNYKKHLLAWTAVKINSGGRVSPDRSAVINIYYMLDVFNS